MEVTAATAAAASDNSGSSKRQAGRQADKQTAVDVVPGSVIQRQFFWHRFGRNSLQNTHLVAVSSSLVRMQSGGLSHVHTILFEIPRAAY